MSQHIRSFVRREGRITTGQKNAWEKFWPQYGIELSDSPINFTDVFGNNAPVTLEIGFGMGQTLLELAQQHPDINHIGVEVHRPGVGVVLAQLAANNLTNVRIYCADVIEVLNCIPNNSLNSILILFPDPWPKKKHHKRRLIQAEFISLLQQKLKLHGSLHIATDWENYAEHIEEVMVSTKGWKKIRPCSRPITKFEQRGKKLGHDIWDFCYANNCTRRGERPFA